jgi:tryptophan synthase beta subunit
VFPQKGVSVSFGLSVAKNTLYVESKISSMITMGKINLEINDDLEKKFRRLAVEKFEARKGFLKKAIEEAIRDWIHKNNKGAKNV